MTRFDAYSATTTAIKHEDAFGWIFKPGDQIKIGRGYHSFGQKMAAVDASGTEVGYVMWGGSQGDRIMIEAKGERTPGVVDSLRKADEEHRCTRADSCADFDEPGAFERLLEPLITIKRARKIYAKQDGDWEMPELGRTYMMGAPTSAVRCRLYEKGKQPEYRHLGRQNWTRVEVQVRPATTGAKQAFARMHPDDIWGASRWTRDIAAEILRNHIDPHPAGTTYKLTERETALRWMCRQYGAHLVSLAQDLGGWECVGLTLQEMLKEHRGH